MADKKYSITHLGKTLNTNHYYPLTDDQCEVIRQAHLKRASYDAMIENLFDVRNGGTNTTAITNYYFKDLMCNVRIYTTKWTINETFESNDLIRYYYSRTQSNDNLWPRNKSDIENIYTAIRIGGAGVAMKPSNFPMKTIDEILQKYNINDNYYDFSCGWGVRLLSSLKNGVNYHGTDPNHVLVDRLRELHREYNDISIFEANADIRCTGSEVFHSDWENKMGLAFSSPPYFKLEDYRIGDQSTSDDTDYDTWKNEYLRPTIQNCIKYVIKDGHILVNIKDYSVYPLYSDTFNICEELGLKHVDTLVLKNITRPSDGVEMNTDENIMVFKNTNK